MGDYRKLDVWKFSCVLSDRVEAVVEGLPARIRARKGDQLLRAVDSIHENIAEGCGLNTDPQLARHLRIALGSANEVEDELAALNRRGLLKESDQDLMALVRLICRMLAGLIKKIDPRQ